MDEVLVVGFGVSVPVVVCVEWKSVLFAEFFKCFVMIVCGMEN